MIERPVQPWEYWPNQHEGQMQWVQISDSVDILYRTDGWLITDYVWRNEDDRMLSFLRFYCKLVVL